MVAVAAAVVTIVASGCVNRDSGCRTPAGGPGALRRPARAPPVASRRTRGLTPDPAQPRARPYWAVRRAGGGGRRHRMVPGLAPPDRGASGRPWRLRVGSWAATRRRGSGRRGRHRAHPARRRRPTPPRRRQSACRSDAPAARLGQGASPLRRGDRHDHRDDPEQQERRQDLSDRRPRGNRRHRHRASRPRHPDGHKAGPAARDDLAPGRPPTPLECRRLLPPLFGVGALATLLPLAASWISTVEPDASAESDKYAVEMTGRLTDAERLGLVERAGP